MKIMKSLLLILVTIMLSVSVGNVSEAKTVNRYTTQKVSLKKSNKNGAKTVCKVDACTKLKVEKQGKTWARAIYKDQKVYVKVKYLHKKKPVNKYKGKSFKRIGRGHWNGWSWTWYTTRQFPDRRNSLGIKGKHTDKRGFVCDKDGYICLASGRGNKKKHAIVPTPFGKYGKVYDTNGGYNNQWFDVYVNW